MKDNSLSSIYEWLCNTDPNHSVEYKMIWEGLANRFVYESNKEFANFESLNTYIINKANEYGLLVPSEQMLYGLSQMNKYKTLEEE